MDLPYHSDAPAKLYAFLLKLRPLQAGTLMPFSGELVHGAWLHWLREVAPDIAAWLHNENKRRLFTCSSLQFPVPALRMREAERDNVHLPLDPEKTYTVRITLLLGDLFPLFYNPVMRICKQIISLEEVIMNNDDSSGWTGFTSLNALVEKAKTQKLGATESLTLEFASLTTVNRSNTRNKGYGEHHARLPLPQYIFPGLARRWEELAPPELVGVVQKDRIEQYIQDDGVIIVDYELKTPHVTFTTTPHPHFVEIYKY